MTALKDSALDCDLLELKLNVFSLIIVMVQQTYILLVDSAEQVPHGSPPLELLSRVMYMHKGENKFTSQLFDWKHRLA